MLQTLGRILEKCSIIPGGLIILASTVNVISLFFIFNKFAKISQKLFSRCPYGVLCVEF